MTYWYNQENWLEMMVHKLQVVMAIFDYSMINSVSESTLSNRELVKVLLQRTKGKLMIMNADGLFTDPSNHVALMKKVNEAQKENE